MTPTDTKASATSANVGSDDSAAGGLCNIAAHLPRMAAQHPDNSAVVIASGRLADGTAKYDTWTFARFNAESDRVAHGLLNAGVTRGMRTLLMVRPSLEYYALVFGLMKAGAVPVVIDPGMGRRKMVECLAGVRAEAFIGIPLAHALRKLHAAAFRSVKVVVTVGRRWFWGGLAYNDIRADTDRPFDIAAPRADDMAAILFTSGSTGPAKGVVYEHGVFAAQVRMLREMYDIRPGEVDLATFPLFALFDPALGMTSVVPEMNPTRPADADPVKIIEAIRDNDVTNMFASPALLDRVGRYGEAKGITLPTLKRVMSAGAPASPEALRRFQRLLTGDAEIHTPYGATEALPVSTIGSREVLSETAEQTARGRGVCVGRCAAGMTVRIIEITDEPIAEWHDDLSLPAGEIGEIVVADPVVTQEYWDKPEATRLAKIAATTAAANTPDPNTPKSRGWHRMGDVGYFDERGRLWMCGRKSHRVVTEKETLFTIPCERVFNEHPLVRRTALVGVGAPPTQRPVLCVELEPGARVEETQLQRDLLALGEEYEHTRCIRTILIHPAFPVDIRHNAKIFREKLSIWAAARL